ncbi:hypothetical protein CPB84DRAFT_1962220 [Gymnopilus junonius]|uniref:ATPase inhibitor, mitochondrial n=1 Tax=Gymnopilus junonius TaxID=109634 RepID=A0A9P5NNP2_GYMJU|nr:hypothetical protein CPB84DRAFT_1962220 [Gymnopilus junonius]
MLSRASALRRLPRAFAAPVRMYTENIGRTSGSVAQSKGFDKKERAHEDQFIRRHEAELLAKLRAHIDARKNEIEELQKQEAELAQKAEAGKE